MANVDPSFKLMSLTPYQYNEIIKIDPGFSPNGLGWYNRMKKSCESNSYNGPRWCGTTVLEVNEVEKNIKSNSQNFNIWYLPVIILFSTMFIFLLLHFSQQHDDRNFLRHSSYRFDM